MTELITTPHLSTPTKPDTFWRIDTIPPTLGEETRSASIRTKYFGKHVLTEVLVPEEAFLLVDKSLQQEQLPTKTRHELRQQERDMEIKSHGIRNLGSRALLSILKPFRR